MKEHILLNNISVIGAGIMGCGIAHVFALGGHQVTLVSRSVASLNRAMETISRNLDRQVVKGVLTEENRKAAIANITTSTSIETGVMNAHLVVETVSEHFDLKMELFKQLDQICSDQSILATNTSSFSITKMGSVTNRADKVIGMHFMNPAPVMPVVEIIRGYATSDNVTASVMNLAKQLGKIPVAVNDYPGFITSRLLAALINEAVCSLHENVAGVEEIDSVMNLGMGHPYGPLRVADFVGLDVVLNVMQLLYQEFKNPKYAPCSLLINMVAAGHLGVKSGRGFYEYSSDSKDFKVALGFTK